MFLNVDRSLETVSSQVFSPYFGPVWDSFCENLRCHLKGVSHHRLHSLEA